MTEESVEIQATQQDPDPELVWTGRYRDRPDRNTLFRCTKIYERRDRKEDAA